MCLKRAKTYIFLLSAAAPIHQEAGTTLKTEAQDRSSPVQHTGVWYKPQGHPGQNRAQQVRLGELLHIPEIEINTNFTLI